MSTDLVLVISFAVIVSLSLAWLLAGRRPHDPARRAQAQADCALLLHLLGLLQKHRGSSAAWLAGDVALGERRRLLQAEIDALWPALNALGCRETSRLRPCFTLNDWALFRFGWTSLLDGLAERSAAEAIQAHGKMIAQLLDWLAAFGEARLERRGVGAAEQGVADYVHRLPALTECLGQARALGCSVAAAGQCAPVARVRLGFLLARVETLLVAASRTPQNAREAGAAQQKVAVFLQLLKDQILRPGPISLSAAECFATATDAIDAVFAWIGVLGESLTPPSAEKPQATLVAA